MSLVLKVSSAKNQNLQTTMEHEFNESGGTIGRKLSNTWVLPDEQRHLSGSHASVEYDNGKYYIIDTSTNGVFINNSPKSLGNGNKQQLEDGFQLVMGTFNIDVNIASDSEVFNDVSSQLTADVSTATSDDLFSDLFDDSESLIKDQLFEPLDPQEKSSSPPISVGSDDPFFDFDEFQGNKDSHLGNEPKAIDRKQSEMDGFFKPAKISRSSKQQDPFDDLNDVKVNENNVLESSSDASGIPDDWILPSGTDNSFDDLLKGFDEPLVNQESVNKPLLEENINVSKNEMPKRSFTDVPSSIHIETGNNNAFLRGLGIDEKSLKGELSEQQLFLAGKLFRSAIKGTVGVLQSRAEIKNEMRMDMTTIQPIQNNPIKFAIDIDEAISKLLMQDNKSYMDPEQAMDEVYDDITSHQLAIISGIQASLSHVLKRFEPKTLITRFEEDNPISASIPVHRKAKLWEAFEKLYDTIESEAEDDFNRLFGQEFAKAYDEQVENLKKKRAK